MSFDDLQFRQALGRFATGVCVITANPEGHVPFGLTVNSFASLSLTPPLVLWSLSRAAASLPAFSTGSHYAINILGADQKALAERFASKRTDRWLDVPFTEGICGAPLLTGATATFECFNRSRYEEGDHVIFVGEVEHVGLRDAIAPLVYQDGAYCVASPASAN